MKATIVRTYGVAFWLLATTVVWGQNKKDTLEVISDAFGYIHFGPRLNLTNDGLWTLQKLGAGLRENPPNEVSVVTLHSVTKDSISFAFQGTLRCGVVIDSLIKQGAGRHVFMISFEQVKKVDEGVAFTVTQQYRNVLVAKKNGRWQQKHVPIEDNKRIHLENDSFAFDPGSTAPSVDGLKQIGILIRWIEKHHDKCYQVILEPGQSPGKSEDLKLSLIRCETIMKILKLKNIPTYIHYPTAYSGGDGSIHFYIEELSFGPDSKTEDEYFKE